MDEFGIVWMVLALATCISGGFWYYWKQAENKRLESLERAEITYKRLLSEVENHPRNSGYRQAALQAGRDYFFLLYRSKDYSVLGEAAIKNDLDAASAGAAP
jgi:hypothetical protein